MTAASDQDPQSPLDDSQRPQVPPAATAGEPLTTSQAARVEPTVQFNRPQVDVDLGDPEQIGRYQIQSMLGQGGFGSVYLAVDQQLHRQVAIKLPRYGQSSEVTIDLTEAKTVASLDHPGIVPVYDVGQLPDGRSYVVSKYIDGGDLAQRIQTQPLSTAEVVQLIETVACTLDYVHSRGIIHRDIKPGNIMLDRGLQPYVSDFGLAIREDQATAIGSRIGTLRYMSPEQARGEGHLVDGRSDLFSLAVVMYELLTGARPFDGNDAHSVMQSIVRCEPRPLREFRSTVPRELERICLKALSRRAPDRYERGNDLADDLKHWLRQQATLPAGDNSSPEFLLGDQVADTSTRQISIVPRGLRSFGPEDAYFFLHLLPGPRDREGLPESIQRWRRWVVQAAGEDHQRIGVVYGPSGCGKSSLIRAGLLPLLPANVRVIAIESTGERTESQLIRKLAAEVPELATGKSLAEQLGQLRRGEGLGEDERVLLVFDQFEQWLHGQVDMDHSELTIALRQCDGIRVQTLLLARDDFWLALSRFMQSLEVPLLEGRNVALVDLFDPLHARHVLKQFGQAYGRISPGNPAPAEERFLDQAIDELLTDGKVYPVRLALFAEIMKGRVWEPETLQRFGGVEGIGVRFLEESFSLDHAAASHRVHEPAVRRLLESLLPDSGTDIKARRRSRADLLRASGYEEQPDRFAQLLTLLDSELRLITPTETGDSQFTDSQSADRDANDGSSKNDQTDSSASRTESAFYQLTHDYLVPSIREWLGRKQRETYRGRLQLQFRERVALWQARPEPRYLPSWAEWLKYRIVLRGADKSEPERRMMSQATRRHTQATVLVLVLLIAAGWFAVSNLRDQQAGLLVEQLATAQLSDVPDLVEQLEGHQRDAFDRLTTLAESAGADRELELKARLALLNWDPQQTERVVQLALDSNPEMILAVIQTLDEFPAEVVEPLQETLQDTERTADERVRAALMLAGVEQLVGDQPWDGWPTHAELITQYLLETTSESPQYFQPLILLTRPIRTVLREPLQSSADRTKRDAVAMQSTVILANLFSDDAETLLQLLLTSADWRLQLLLPSVAQQLPEMRPVLLAAVEEADPAADAEPEIWERAGRRKATAAALLLRVEETDSFQKLLRLAPQPAARAYLIHRLHQVNAPLEPVVEELERATEPGPRQGLLLAIGEYPQAAAGSSLRTRAVRRAIELYREDSDPGVHSAAWWMLSKWASPDELPTVVRPSKQRPSVLSWRMNDHGQLMIRVDGRQHPKIGYVYEISAHEITVAQFRKYAPNAYHHVDTSPEVDCPINLATWIEAAQYCRWLSEVERVDAAEMSYPLIHEIDESWSAPQQHASKFGYRIPRMVEWEFACRAGTLPRRYFGHSDELLSKYCWYEANSGGRSWPVGRLKPNDWGLFDGLGNAQEWCEDLADNNHRYLRGASYGHFAEAVDVKLTRTALAATEFNSISFRVVRTVPRSEWDFASD